MSNLLLSVFVARAASVREFGAFSLAFAAYTLLVGLSRWVGGNIFAIRYSSSSRAEQQQHYRHLTGVGLSVSLIGAVVLLAAAVAGGPSRPYFITVAVFLPGLILLDDWRQAMFVARDSRAAFLCDLLWLVVQIPLFVLVFVVARHQPIAYLAAWGAAAGVGACAFAIWQRTIPSVVAASRFVRRNMQLVPGLVGEYAALIGGTQLLPYGVAATIGLSAAGGLRAAQVIFGLAASPLMGLVPLVMVYTVRAYDAGGTHLQRLRVLVTALGCVWVAAFTGAVQAIPDHIGRQLAGESWNSGKHLLLAMGVVYVAQWVSTVNLIAMRAVGDVRRVATLRLVLTVLTLATTLGLAASYGLLASVWGMAGAAVAGAVGSAIAVRRPQRSPAKELGQLDAP